MSSLLVVESTIIDMKYVILNKSIIKLCNQSYHTNDLDTNVSKNQLDWKYDFALISSIAVFFFYKTLRLWAQRQKFKHYKYVICHFELQSQGT